MFVAWWAFIVFFKATRGRGQGIWKSLHVCTFCPHLLWLYCAFLVVHFFAAMCNLGQKVSWTSDENEALTSRFPWNSWKLRLRRQEIRTSHMILFRKDAQTTHTRAEFGGANLVSGITTCMSLFVCINTSMYVYLHVFVSIHTYIQCF